MGNVRTSKIYRINVDENFICNYGTLDKNDPKVLFVRVKAKIKPLFGANNYVKQVRMLKKSINSSVLSAVRKYNKVFDSTQFLFDTDLTENCMSLSKKSNIKFDLFLKPLEVKDIMEYEDIIKVLLSEIIESVKDIAEKFEFVILGR